MASAGSGHRGVTGGTPAAGLTGCDTLLSTINEHKGAADGTRQPGEPLQVLTAR